ncbi:oxygen-regulated protein 1 [Xyrichtys novacula]|uniref:Oxygen-regulated protein 1 n=1 Tax=Xyrichtys novacula TaxID=13765 RepID=A0AAV1GI48_XYRNO|nr:oxygen-regulated protein 1 [Xyrichtys novacula]
MPQDDDIEKSFRVNQDGSMTVEMKVRLTIKEEEMLHWTTTLSRTCLSKRTACASISESGKSSTDSNNAVAKNSTSISGDELKEGNHPAVGGKGVKFNDERVVGRAKSGFRRSPTPGAQQVKRASVESVKMVTESGVQESTLGHYSYMERTVGGEKTEGYRVVRHSSSNRPIPKPRKTASAGAIIKGSHSSIRSSGVAEVLQIQNNGMEVTETVMHIYESQGGYDNYFANEDYSADGAHSFSSTPVLDSKLSVDSGPLSSSNDCDIDFSGQQAITDSQQRQKEEMLSLSSEPITQTHEITNHLSLLNGYGARTKDKSMKNEKKTTVVPPHRSLKNLMSTNNSEKKKKESRESLPKNRVKSSNEKQSSNASVGKKSLSSSESAKSLQKTNGAEKSQVKKASKDVKIPRREPALLANAVNVKRNLTLRQNLDNGHHVHARPQMKKNISDILQPKKTLLPARKLMNRPKSMSDHTLSTPKKSVELSESLSVPSFKPSLSEIHQYVENWLEKVSPDPVLYTEETTSDESKTQTKVVFQIGDDSESDNKTERKISQDECIPPPPGDVKKSASCLTVPQHHADPSLLHNEQYARGLCASMPSVRVDPSKMENVMRPHKSEEAISPATNEAPSSSSNFLSPHTRIKPVLKQIYSSIQCIRGASDTTNTASNLEKSTSLPDFPNQVASVFGSSCKAFLSFLSVVTLRDNLNGSEMNIGETSRSDSEAMLMMQSLQKISAIEDAEEQRASLTDLQSRASSQLRARWKDFQILRERLESEPLSPRVSETEFALDVVSEGGDVFDDQHLEIDGLMEEMNMPRDLRAEIFSTMQHSRFFYPIEESTFVETERNQSDSEEDVEKFVEEENDETEKQSPETDSATMAIESETELKVEKTDNKNKDSGILRRGSNDWSRNEEGREETEKEYEGENREQEDDTKEGDEVDGESGAEEMESERESEEELDDKRPEDGEGEDGSNEGEEYLVKLEEGTEEETAMDEEEEGGTEKREGDMNGEGLDGDGDQTDDREGGEDEADEEEVQDEGGDESEGEENEDTVVDEETEEEENEEDEENEEEENEETIVADEVTEEQENEDAEVEEETVEDENEEMIEVDEETAEQERRQDEVDEMAEEENEETVTDQEEEEEEEDEDDVGVEEEVRGEETDQEEEAENITELEEEEEAEGVNEDVEEDRELVEEEDLEEEVHGTNEEDVTEEKEEVMGITEMVGKIIQEEDKVEEDKEVEETVTEVEGEEKEDEGEESWKNQEKTEDSYEDKSDLEVEFVEGIEIEEGKEESEAEDENVSDTERKHQLEQSSREEDNRESVSTYSSEVQCEDEKGDGAETATETETEEGGERQKEQGSSLPHPVEISQELLDFINTALQCASLIFTYDAHGKIRIEPDSSRGAKTPKEKKRKDSSYGVKCLPSPACSDLSDYRPETSESGGYQSQESVEVISESGEDGQEKHFPFCKRKPKNHTSKLPVVSHSKVLQNSHTESGGSYYSNNSGTRASKDLSYFSGGSSQKADNEAAPDVSQCISFHSEKDSKDGVLIDQGRWLLKENHLIRTSPPVAQGMYSNIDSTSSDTRSSDDSPLHYKTQQNLLAALSSTELEEMAKPKTPKCTYYNMPHGSDSDPFLDDSSFKSGKKDRSSAKGRGGRVGPTINTSQTWANKNGSLSSFASVEFNIPDRKVHPEGETISMTMARRTSGGGGRAVQAQDSVDTLYLRCSQYCPIL